MTGRVLIGLSVFVLCVFGEGPAMSASPPAARVVVVVMENKGFRTIVGSPDAPYFNGLSGGLLTNYWSVAHPSLPNYLAMMGAWPPLPPSDDPGIRISGDSFPEEMLRHGHSVRAYMQGLPRDGFGGSGYPLLGRRYVLKHDPFLLFSRMRSRSSWRKVVTPLSRLSEDLKSGTLPEMSLIVPDLCHDMHGAFLCHFRSPHDLIRAGDRFLERWIPRILRAPSPPGERTWIIIVWDEGDQGQGANSGRPPRASFGGPRLSGGGRVPFLWIDSRERRRWSSSCFANHYSLLETLTRNFSLPELSPPGERRPLPEKGTSCPTPSGRPE